MKQLEVQIMGQSYLLGCPEGGEARFKDAVDRVDAAMCKIRDAGKVRARDRIAVLAALNLAFDLSEKVSAPPVVPATQGEGPPSALEEGPRLNALLQRLDSALADDGRLF
jgi:cell division protein ZapA